MRYKPGCAVVCLLFSALASALIFFDPFAVYGVMLAGVFFAIALVGFFRSRLEKRRRRREEQEAPTESAATAGTRLRGEGECVRPSAPGS